MTSAKIILDSVAPNGRRLTTFELTYWRAIHAELMTHRLFSRNASSTRAIPTKKMLERVERYPAVPMHWSANQTGMRADQQIQDDADLTEVKALWQAHREYTIKVVERLNQLGLHKAIAGRLLEPHNHITVIVTASEFAQWYHQRRDDNAEPHIHHLADLMYEAQKLSRPYYTAENDWHMPFITDFERQDMSLGVSKLLKVSVARCARVSYLNHDGTKPNVDKDVELFDKLVGGGHWSPFEHVAKAMGQSDGNVWSGNIRGWHQYRKMFGNEHREVYP